MWGFVGSAHVPVLHTPSSPSPVSRTPCFPSIACYTYSLFPSSIPLQAFLVVLLQPPHVGTSSPLHSTTDPDPLINCDLMDGRDAFLTLCRGKHWEFSSLRRAKFSSMAMLYEIHNQISDGLLYTCNNCHMNVETWYHCRECDVSRHNPAALSHSILFC